MAVNFYKAILVVLNIVFMVIGVILLVLGLMFKIRWNSVRDAFQSVEGKGFNVAYAGETVATSVIVFGAFILFMALLGMVGAMCEVRLLLTLYTFLVIVAVIAELTTIILIGTKGLKAMQTLDNTLMNVFKGYNETNEDARSKAISVLFSMHQCCGLAGDKDFDMSSNDPIIPWFPDEKKRKAGDIHGKAKLPLTCCKGVHQEHITQRNYEVAKDCLLGHTNGTAYTQGCQKVIANKIKVFQNTSIGVGISIIIIEIMLILTSCCMCCGDNTAKYFKHATLE